MNVENIEINTQSNIKMILDKITYFDPFQIKNDLHDADIIFITHSHYDHFDIASINKIIKENTIIVAPKTMEEEIKKYNFKDYKSLNPFDEIKIDNINIKAIPAYNINKPFHSKLNNWLGYLINFKNITYYIAGDTDKIEESEKIKCDVALIPIGGYFTMDVNEAHDLIKIIKPKVVIPTHYGSIIGDKEDGKRLKNSLSDTMIEVIEKL